MPQNSHMVVTGKRLWAYIEARKRCRANFCAYSIYQSRIETDEYIVRQRGDEPDPRHWIKDATYRPLDGLQHHTMEMQP